MLPPTPSGDSSYNSDYSAATPQSSSTSRNRNSSSLSSSAFSPFSDQPSSPEDTDTTPGRLATPPPNDFEIGQFELAQILGLDHINDIAPEQPISFTPQVSFALTDNGQHRFRTVKEMEQEHG